MSEPIWNQFLTERDKAVFAASGYGARGGFGKRPALLVIDVNYAFCGDKPEPILEFEGWTNRIAQFGLYLYRFEDEHLKEVRKANHETNTDG